MDLILRQFGFGPRYEVDGRLSIADLAHDWESRCGIYCLEFADGAYYIGQAVDAIKRFSQHRKNHQDIVGYRFQPVPRMNLDRVERELIYQAQRERMTLRNIVFNSAIVGEADLDSVLSREEQDSWLEDPSGFWNEPFRVSDERQRYLYTAKFAKLSGKPQFDRIVAILRNYTRWCIPAFRRTEMSFWSVSCLPATNKNIAPRYACVNIGAMEGLVIGHWPERPSASWVLVNVAKSELKQRMPWLRRLALYRFAYLTSDHYLSAGPDHMTIHIRNLDSALRLLQDEAVQRAARLLNIRLMRKGATKFSRYHCFDLADLLVD